MVEGKIMSYLEIFFFCFYFSIFSVTQVVQEDLNAGYLNYLQ